jgi:hypothetical protein
MRCMYYFVSVGPSRVPHMLLHLNAGGPEATWAVLTVNDHWAAAELSLVVAFPIVQLSCLCGGGHLPPVGVFHDFAAVLPLFLLCPCVLIFLVSMRPTKGATQLSSRWHLSSAHQKLLWTCPRPACTCPLCVHPISGRTVRDVPDWALFLPLNAVVKF